MIERHFAGLAWRFVPLDASASEALAEAFCAFAPTDAAEAPLRPITVKVAAATACAPFPTTPDLVVSGDEDHVELQRADLLATLDLSERRLAVAYSGALPSLSAALRVTAALMLAREGGLLVHAASIVSDGQALLFPGPSGSGKTTISRLAQDRAVLSDEVSAVIAADDGYQCYPTPFWGDYEGERRGGPGVRLHRICFPAHGDWARLRRLSAAAAAARLLACVFCYGTSPLRRRQLFDTCLRLVHAVPCYRLEFRPDPSFWSELHA